MAAKKEIITDLLTETLTVKIGGKGYSCKELANKIALMVTYLSVSGIPKNTTLLISRNTPLSINDKLLQENRYEIAKVIDSMVLQVYDSYGKPMIIRKNSKGETIV